MWFFNYYTRVIENTMQTSASSIVSSLSNRSWKDLKFRIIQFLEFAATHHNAKNWYRAIQMHLLIQSDASYLNESKASYRNGGFFDLSDIPKLKIKPKYPPPKFNAPVIVNSKIINTVVSSFQESETGSGFINGKDYVTLRNSFHGMGHIQGLTPIQYENIVINGIFTDTVVQCRSTATDMLFYWLCGWCRQKQLNVHLKQGKHNISDYSSKYNSTQLFISVWPTYVLNPIQKQTKTLPKLSKLPTTLQVCVQNVLPPTNEQPSDYKSSMPLVFAASVLNQQRHLTRHSFNLSETDCPNTIDWTNDAI